MSMSHKAYVFDHERFAVELLPILERALAHGQTNELEDWIEQRRERLKDPYEGQPLDRSWRSMLETVDAHQLGDFALTAYYDPIDDIGLGDRWLQVRSALQGRGLDPAVLGRAIGPESVTFDPGKMGSYFQTAADVKRNAQDLERAMRGGSAGPEFKAARELLMSALNERKGLYVTF
jgi:hypothetical protein